ncbi:glycosyl transferase, family 25 [Aureimonas altamirensis DSM 21988]|uniref:Glycosyl transferase, family 25 n=1 Tax=Aureimonas altamirensis DSM 21988 TaxID=1121026 RepID=A0ABY1IE44_9HYPH|nr:glycosyltransferase family 25 protein [Aureimonas altamirensis]SHJ04162.1 glycosyl transferase, family 25 [Aureimonas altamirensis DSM 21988]
MKRSLGIYAINLNRSPERWQALAAAFSPLPYPLKRVPALDARLQPQAVLDTRGLSIALPPAGLGYSTVRGREYLLVQEACFASHIVALRCFLSGEHELALILEDDAVPGPRTAPVLEALCGLDTPFDVVRLEAIRLSGSRPAVKMASLGAETLVRSLKPSSGSAAYVVTRRAAERLIAAAGRDLMPFDDYLANPSMHGCDVAYVSPLPIRQADAPSVIAESYDRSRLRRQRGLMPFLRQARVRGRLRVGLWAWALRGGGVPRNYRW